MFIYEVASTGVSTFLVIEESAARRTAGFGFVVLMQSFSHDYSTTSSFKRDRILRQLIFFHLPNMKLSTFSCIALTTVIVATAVVYNKDSAASLHLRNVSHEFVHKIEQECISSHF